jgi:hypothetical protein
MQHILNFDKTDNILLEQLFRNISDRNTFLFLGAGASIGKDKGFLSKHLIEFFQDKKGIDLGIENIIEFVDVLSNTPGLSRDEFDEYVDMCLRKLKVTPAHKILASIPWKQIITTNYDLIIEQAFESLLNTPDENLKLKPVRGQKELIYQCSNDELKFIKLNGCISLKKEFPMIFSTEDFRTANKYYKNVLNELKNPSDKISFLSIGYSFSDPFAKHLFEIIDKMNFRDKRTFYTVDPYINEAMLPLFNSKKICVIKCSFEDFMNKYKEWEEKNYDALNKSARKVSYTTPTQATITLNNKILYRLQNHIVQLNPSLKTKNISSTEYYRGEEPDYNIILKNFDVKKIKLINHVKESITLTTRLNDSNIIPIFFLTGTFGTGKSTFAYRLINSIVTDIPSTVAFEIYDPYGINVHDLTELFNSTLAQNIILYSNAVDVDNTFKSLLTLRNNISLEQYKINIYFIATIRENILEQHNNSRQIRNQNIIEIDQKLNKDEVEELVTKLKDAGLLNYRDINEKQLIINKILKSYKGDSFISLMELINGSKHVDDLIEAYNQLGKTAKKAFLFTSFLYQHKILMPAGVLMSIVSTDWESFRKDVIEVEGKGILLQEQVKSNGTDPDLYFKTKHPLISKKLVDTLVQGVESKYKYYQSIITHITNGQKNSLLVTNLLKALRVNEEVTMTQLDRLFDLAHQELSDDPHFLLHYAINLQHRGDEKSLNKAIDLLIYADSILPYRNHKHIHRRAVANFNLAKIWYNKETQGLIKTLRFLQEARELFELKKIYDPCSSYSYYDYIMLEIWHLEHIQLSEDDNLKARIKIEELFDVALKVVFEQKDRILRLQNEYIQKYQFNENESKYLTYLEETYGNPELRPYALILLFNYYINKNELSKCEEYLEELEYYSDNTEVLKLLFKYYGRNLHNIETRLKFFDLTRNNPNIEDTDSLRFNYFNYIAEAYSKNFKDAYTYASKIQDRFNYLNPDFQLEWLDSDTNKPEIFEGNIIINKKGYKKIRIPMLSSEFVFLNKKEETAVGAICKVKLFFFLTGIRAQIIK